MTENETDTDRTEHLVNCRECDFWSIEPNMQSADLTRDGHELEMFNWRNDNNEPCGPCAVTSIRSFGY